jgi:hypothetical protein
MFDPMIIVMKNRYDYDEYIDYLIQSNQPLVTLPIFIERLGTTLYLHNKYPEITHDTAFAIMDNDIKLSLQKIREHFNVPSILSTEYPTEPSGCCGGGVVL